MLFRFWSCQPGVDSFRGCSRSGRSSCASKRSISNRLYSMSRHFVWMIPLTNLVIFVALGVVFSLLVRGGYCRGRWLAVRLLAALTLLPSFWVAFPQIYGPAGFLLVLGVAAHVVPALERACHWLSAAGRVQLPVDRRTGADPGGRPLGVRPHQGMARGGTAAPAAGFPQRPLDRTGHGGSGPFEPPRLQPAHQPDDR